MLSKPSLGRETLPVYRVYVPLWSVKDAHEQGTIAIPDLITSVPSQSFVELSRAFSRLIWARCSCPAPSTPESRLPFTISRKLDIANPTHVRLSVTPPQLRTVHDCIPECPVNSEGFYDHPFKSWRLEGLEPLWLWPPSKFVGPTPFDTSASTLGMRPTTLRQVWDAYSSDEKRNIAIFIAGLMLYKLGLEAVSTNDWGVRRKAELCL